MKRKGLIRQLVRLRNSRK